MTMITVNQLFQLLVEEVNNFDFSSYQRLLLRKAELTIDVKKNFAGQTAAAQLRSVTLPEQIKVVSYYTERLPRIERILTILKKSKCRIASQHEKVYKSFIRLLQALIEVGRNYLLTILQNQRKALEEQNYRKYLSLVGNEINASYRLVGPISQFGIEISTKIRKLGVTFHGLSINFKTILLAELAVLTLAVSVLGGAVITGQVRSRNESARIAISPLAQLIKNCGYSLGITLSPDSPPQRIAEVVRAYYDNDLKHELQLEADFEAETGLKVYGDYTLQDLTLLREFLLKTYGLGIAEKLSTRSLYFLPPSAVAFLQTSSKANCPQLSVRGLVREEGITLTSSYNNEFRYEAVLAHEIAHAIHGNVSKVAPKFDREWSQIKGGFARDYGVVNRSEDVATVVEEAIVAFLEGRDVRTLMAFDGNSNALQRKLQLLKRYGFFPDQLQVY